MHTRMWTAAAALARLRPARSYLGYRVRRGLHAAAGAVALPCIDHLIWTHATLEQGVQEATVALGVVPAAGGRHKDWGTHNALLSLGGRAYLEMVAPDPHSSVPPQDRPGVLAVPPSLQLRGAGAPVLNGWVATHNDIENAVAVCREHGYMLGEPLHGHRRTVTGQELTWSITDPRAPALFDGVMPLLIDWTSVDEPHHHHPSSTAPPGGALVGLHLQHPRADALTALLALLGIPATVAQADTAGIAAVVETAGGAHVHFRPAG